MNKLNSLQQINTNVPRETLVFSADDLVVKRPVVRALPPQTWLAKQQHAMQVMDSLNKIGNSAYFVPQMLEISKDAMFAIESRAHGYPISSEYFKTLSAADHGIIYNAIAHFMNDINQSRPIMNQSEFLDMGTDKTFDATITELKGIIPASELKIMTAAKKWFDVAAKNDASIVFSHGDMNENNIFYDPTKRVVSFIDFADAKYENITYMFEHDFGKLKWLNLDRIRREYIALPRKNPVVITTNTGVADMRMALQNIKWLAVEFLKSPNGAVGKVRQKMINDEIQNLQKLYANIQHNDRGAKFTHGADAIHAGATSNMMAQAQNNKGK